MKKIKLTEEQEKEYPFSKDIIEIFNTYSGDELLDSLEAYVMDACSYSAEALNKQLLLGTVCLYGPEEFDDWTDEEKLALFDRWAIVDKLVALSKYELISKQLDEEEEEEKEDPNRNNGKGMIS